MIIYTIAIKVLRIKKKDIVVKFQICNIETKESNEIKELFGFIKNK